MKGLLDMVTRIHYFYSHVLPSSGRASENVTNRALLANVVPQSAVKSQNEETKTIAYCTDNGLQLNGNQTMIGRQTAEKHLPT